MSSPITKRDTLTQLLEIGEVVARLMTNDEFRADTEHVTIIRQLVVIHHRRLVKYLNMSAEDFHATP